MKKILIVDDQELVLISLEKCLSDLGYKIKSVNNIYEAIFIYDSFLPDLIISDVNMPDIINRYNSKNSVITQCTVGLELVKYIRQTQNHQIPIMVLSGNTDESIISQGFELGIDDYMKKPVSLTEIGARVKRLIGPAIPIEIGKTETSEKYIQKGCVGVVIPCYNEAERLPTDEFKKFIDKNLGYHVCFVNDGSKDNTLEVLEKLRHGKEDYISIYNCEKNGGKAEAVRLGMLHLNTKNQYNYIGFLDADLSTNFEDFQGLVNTISTSDFQIVTGSRMSRMGADITKESSSAIINNTINFFIRKTLGMDIKDTQCGAKVMTKEIIEKTFKTKFLTKWLFDVEIFMRMKKAYGSAKAKELICEQPLKRWIHADGSKLSFKDSLKIVGQIGQIAISYK